ncbi:MAG TPA: lysophospholipid acyltransferase family protein [Gemmatimonadaceae bacterium]|nr:lysophospholipid acyltransferase family protein [Gemmatimonadaceae bacterium]
MRLILVAIAALIATPALTLLLVIARLLRIPDRPGSVYDGIPRWWAKVLLWTAGVEVRVHGAEWTTAHEPRIFVGNHVSWFDVLASAAVLPRGKYVAKAELFRVPVFGHAIRWIGMVPIERENRKAAFGAIEKAAAKIRGGNSVVMFAEGTRGDEYPLRTFKKGPFVLAITAGVPIVPMVIHGTIERMRRDSWQINPGTIEVTFLEPIPTAGYSYEDRGALVDLVRSRMAGVLRDKYGVERQVPAGETNSQ